MTPLDTCDAIERFLREKFQDVRLPGPGGDSAINFFQMSLPQPAARPPTPRAEDADGNEIAQCDARDDAPLDEVIDGGYTRGEARDIFPAVAIRPVKMTGSGEDGFWDKLTVVITAGTFDESGERAEGLKGLVNILERCRQLFEKNRILEERYQIDLPLTYELYDESVRPFFFGELVTEWNLKAQAEEIEPMNDWRRGWGDLKGA